MGGMFDREQYFFLALPTSFRFFQLVPSTFKYFQVLSSTSKYFQVLGHGLHLERIGNHLGGVYRNIKWAW